ncbi:MAG: helix-turn-helix transcriptional regulator [Myxococcota bacterium]
MYDVRHALTDMANQLRTCRARDGLTLQQLATRCGVAASTIHKIESQQMVPTVSVLLKIARGLGRRPEELVRDRFRDGGETAVGRAGAGVGASASPAPAGRARDGAASGSEEEALFDRGVGAWRIDFARDPGFGVLSLESSQRAILIVERGQAELSSHRLRTRLGCGECVELRGEQFTLTSDATDPAAVLLIASPAGRLGDVLGPPNAAPRPHPRPAPKAASAPARLPRSSSLGPVGG